MVGRKNERKRLLKAKSSEYSEFVAVYGRRRVGKTFLVRETFGYSFTFQHSGVANGTLAEQLHQFRAAIMEQGYEDCPRLASWFDAFDALKHVISHSSETKKTIFIDELPYMDVVGSRLVPALEHFWNAWASARKDVLLIVCGSATSWVLNNVVHSKGGLHGRVTERIRLQPFTLAECREYAASLGLEMTDYQIAEMYMILGGIPYYWKYLDRSLSPAQNIDEMFFAGSDKLENEYDELYSSLFRKKEAYMRIVSVLGSKKAGMERGEIAAGAKVSNSGTLTKYLQELEQCGLIRKYLLPGKKVKGAIYQLMDNFTLFHFKFIANNPKHDRHFWTSSLDSPFHVAWEGLAFERLCLWHVEQIKRALQIGGVLTNSYVWRHVASSPDDVGAQIDLLIDRNDGIVNICEMKFCSDEYAITAEDAMSMRRKKEVFRRESATRKAIHVTYVTTFGLKRNAYANDVQSEVSLNDLFRED